MPSRRTDVPLDRDASGRFLPWLVAFMVYLAALALGSALAVHKVVDRWDRGLAGRLTVQIPPPVSDSALPAGLVEQVVATLKATPGVTGAEVLGGDEMARLLEPWLGEDLAGHALPLPTLIAVTADAARPPDLAALEARLVGMAPGILLDDHQRWLGALLDLAHSIELVAALVVLSVGLSAVVTVVFVTRTGLSMHRQVIELLHLIGAQDAYVARQFQSHALRLGLRGGLFGLALAILTILAVGHLLARAQSGLLPALALAPLDWLALALLPAATALVAMVTARLTVLRTLARLP